MADDENKRLTAEEDLSSAKREMLERLEHEERAVRAALQTAARQITRSSLFVGVGELGEVITISLPSVLVTVENKLCLHVHCPGVVVRVDLQDAERFRAELMEWNR